jgi:hypothetical protein
VIQMKLAFIGYKFYKIQPADDSVNIVFICMKNETVTVLESSKSEKITNKGKSTSIHTTTTTSTAVADCDFRVRASEQLRLWMQVIKMMTYCYTIQY